MADIPKDPMILLSYVNTQLRDHNISLEEFCRANDIVEEELKEKLKSVQYTFDETTNQFI